MEINYIIILISYFGQFPKYFFFNELQFIAFYLSNVHFLIET